MTEAVESKPIQSDVQFSPWKPVETDQGVLRHEAIYNVRLHQILVYVLLDDEPITDLIFDAGETPPNIVKDAAGNAYIEFIQDEELMKFPLVSIK